MNAKCFLYTALFIFSIGFSFGQPLPCEDPPTMTSFCADACIICDIDGFTGRHESDIVGEAPPGFEGECTFFAHNMQWIAFIAGSTDLSVELEVSNCDEGRGLEFGLYKGDGCENLVRISNCFGGVTGVVSPGESGVINNTEPLVIGQYYYIVMDGGMGDNCDWTFNVIEGSTQVAPLVDSGDIQGDNSVCPNLIEQYLVEAPIGATFFEWTVDGASQNNETPALDYTFPDDGLYTICVTAKNACDEGPPSCFLVEVESIPVTEIFEILCEGETFEIENTILSEEGFYQFDLLNEEGCDSIVTVDLIEIITPILNLDLEICEGDTLYIGGTPYTETGIYQEILLSAQECDSIVNLDLFTIVCNISSSENHISPICNGEASGSIEFVIEDGMPPFVYSWEELNGAFSGSGNISDLGSTNIINNIPAGTYVITIEDQFENFDIIVAEITEPPILELEFTTSDYNGYNLSCYESGDGFLLAIPNGGTPQYEFIWSNGSQSEMIDQLDVGLYTITVVDESGCAIEDTYEIISPDSLELLADFQNPFCDGPETGIISVLQTSGGVENYSYSLNGTDFTFDQIFEELPEGAYTLEVMDANGCSTNISDLLIAPQIPEITLGEDIEISLGERITIDAYINDVNLQQINWDTDEILDCYDCLNPEVLPLNSGFLTIDVISEDDCADTDSIYVTVNKFRNLFAPNAFSPDFNGTNDYFTLFGGPEVSQIRKLLIFNRWGALIYEAKEIPSGIETAGWDGTFKGKDVGTDVFVWLAEVEFIDGEVIQFSGDVTTLK